ncbi:MAG: hypothetical protein ACYS72_04670, partial [Planctomycetota bacterium]
MADLNTAAASDAAGTSSMFNVDEILKSAGDWLVTSGLKIFLILILTLVAIKLVQILMDKLFHRLFRNHRNDVEIQKRSDTLKSVTRHLVNITVVVVAVMMVLDQLGVDIGPALAAAGVVGIAVGF